LIQELKRKTKKLTKVRLMRTKSKKKEEWLCQAW